LLRGWLRRQDRMVVCEREPSAAHALAGRMQGDRRIKAVAIDGYMALNAYVPPPERRGLVLIDPPFEQADELDRLGQALSGAHRKWPSGIYVLWYPIKDARATASFARRLAGLSIARILRVEFLLPSRGDDRLRGSGLIVVNPPWTLHHELGTLLPALAHALGGTAGGTRLDWLAGEK
jgi:23S rRNA (adenine2030-N6)-methyltransferase